MKDGKYSKRPLSLDCTQTAVLSICIWLDVLALKWSVLVQKTLQATEHRQVNVRAGLSDRERLESCMYSMYKDEQAKHFQLYSDGDVGRVD